MVSETIFCPPATAGRVESNMSRQPRIFVPGLPAHLVHRGNDRQPIFSCDGDLLFFRECLRRAKDKYGVAIHGYVFMSNHVHLLATPQETDSISRFIQSAARRYVGYFNSRYERSGTLWEGRFHASVIKSDSYLLACHRYIDMNPVRAGMVAGPSGYPWSSHRHYSAGDQDALIDDHALVRGLASDDSTRQAAYRHLFAAPLDADELDAIRSATQSCRPIGGSEGARRRGRPRKMVSDTNFDPIIGAGRGPPEAGRRGSRAAGG